MLVEEKLEEKVVLLFQLLLYSRRKKEIKSTNLEKYTLQFVSAKEKQTTALDDFNSLKIKVMM